MRLVISSKSPFKLDPPQGHCEMERAARTHETPFESGVRGKEAGVGRARERARIRRPSLPPSLPFAFPRRPFHPPLASPPSHAALSPAAAQCVQSREDPMYSCGHESGWPFHCKREGLEVEAPSPRPNMEQERHCEGGRERGRQAEQTDSRRRCWDSARGRGGGGMAFLFLPVVVRLLPQSRSQRCQR